MRAGEITRWVVVVCAAVVAGAPACGSGSKAEGTEGGACYGNDSCNAGLTCLSHLCVDATGIVTPSGDGDVPADAMADGAASVDAATDAGPPAPTEITGECGLSAHTQGCSDCLNKDCCSAGAVCLSFSSCAMCISGLLSGTVCTSNALFTAWEMCAADNCSVLCGD